MPFAFLLTLYCETGSLQGEVLFLPEINNYVTIDYLNDGLGPYY